MTFTQLICIQLLLIVVSHQVLANPMAADSSDGIVSSNRNLPIHDYGYDNLEQILADVDNYETLRQHVFNKLSKRRAQAKANLAGLWGVPTRY